MPNIYVLGGAAIAFVIYTGAVFFEGRHSAESNAKAQARKELVEQLSERSKIDGQVQKLDGAGVCIALGGVWNNGECE